MFQDSKHVKKVVAYSLEITVHVASWDNFLLSQLRSY